MLQCSIGAPVQYVTASLPERQGVSRGCKEARPKALPLDPTQDKSLEPLTKGSGDLLPAGRG